jgi:hypothetical protein
MDNRWRFRAANSAALDPFASALALLLFSQGLPSPAPLATPPPLLMVAVVAPAAA